MQTIWMSICRIRTERSKWGILWEALSLRPSIRGVYPVSVLTETIGIGICLRCGSTVMGEIHEIVGVTASTSPLRELTLLSVRIRIMLMKLPKWWESSIETNLRWGFKLSTRPSPGRAKATSRCRRVGFAGFGRIFKFDSTTISSYIGVPWLTENRGGARIRKKGSNAEWQTCFCNSKLDHNAVIEQLMSSLIML